MPYAGFQAFTSPQTSAALPRGFHIRVFYDRIEIKGERLAPRLLAHVLTHEITHVLQGLHRHSREGIMKARWTYSDYVAMQKRQLVLTSLDIELLHTGIAVRTKVADDERGIFWPNDTAALASWKQPDKSATSGTSGHSRNGDLGSVRLAAGGSSQFR